MWMIRWAVRLEEAGAGAGAGDGAFWIVAVRFV